MNIEAPSSLAVFREARVVREPFRLALRASSLPRATPRPRRVITVPGYGAGDGYMAPLRRYLRRLGHHATGWGLGRNTGEIEWFRPRLDEVVAEAAERHGESVELIGWSLGGILARETARDLPEVVDRVITYGSPVVGGPRYTRTAAAYGEPKVEQLARLVVERERVPIKVPVTAFYSRRDGVVAWQACIDPYANDVEHIEVRSSHVGMGLDPDVWSGIATRIGHPPSD